MSFPRRGLEVDGFFSSSEDSVARTVVDDVGRSVGTQTDGVSTERIPRMLKRAMLGPAKESAGAKKTVRRSPSAPIEIPVRLPAVKRGPPAVEEVWRALHTNPPPGKRLTVHKAGCRCFVCLRQKSTQAGDECRQPFAGAMAPVVVTASCGIDVHQSGV